MQEWTESICWPGYTQFTNEQRDGGYIVPYSFRQEFREALMGRGFYRHQGRGNPGGSCEEK